MLLRSDLPHEMTIRSFALQPDSINDEERSVEAIIATEDDTTVYDMRTRSAVDEVLLMDGWEHVDQVVLVDSHPQARSDRAGITTEDVRGSVRSMRVNNGQLVARLFFATDEASQRLWEKVRAKHVRDISVGVFPLEQTEIPPGRSATVRGKTYAAGQRRKLIETKWQLDEVSVTPRGADTKAKIRQAVFPTPGTTLESVPMNETLRAYFESLGLAKGADEAAVGVFRGKLTAEQKTEADRLAAGGTVRAAVVQPQTSSLQSQPSGLSLTDAGRETAETIRQAAVTAERSRVARINELAGSDIPQELIRQAVSEGWDESRTSREFLTRLREGRQAPSSADPASGPAIHTRSHEADCTLRSLTAGVMHRLGVPIVDSRASETQRAEQARTAEMGERYREMSVIDICREALRFDRRTVPYSRDELIRDAVSSASFSAIFTTSINARLLAAFMEAVDTTGGWCFETDVNNFQTQERASLGKTATPDLLPPGGTASDATFGDGVEKYKIARYAKKLSLDEQNIIDDNLSALQRLPVEMGLACARLRPNLVYAILLANPNMQDGYALFSTQHNNYVTGAGSALSVTSLGAGVTAMSKQTQDSVNIDINPEFLIGPQDLRFTAQTILRSGEVRDTTASTKYPVYNPMQDLTITLRTDNRLGVAGVTDPYTKKVYAGSATNWFLAASGSTGKTIEVGYLTGTGRRPRIRSYILDKGQYGLGWDVNMDIGAKAIAFQGLYMSAGA
jgi:hypothetical protein